MTGVVGLERDRDGVTQLRQRSGHPLTASEVPPLRSGREIDWLRRDRCFLINRIPPLRSG